MSLFSRKPRRPSSMRIDTLVGSGTQLHGDVSFRGGLHVDGVIQGNVMSQPDSEATLSVSDSGVVEGTVNVPNVFLNGRVNGDVIAAQRLELGSTAQVDGDVHYHLIEIALGARINGKLMHVSPAVEKPSVAEATSPAPQLTIVGGGASH